MADLPPHITTHHTTLPPPFPGAPGFTFHLTRLKDTVMVWAGAQTLDDDEGKTRLAAEWAVAMPGRGVSCASLTQLTRRISQRPRRMCSALELMILLWGCRSG